MHDCCCCMRDCYCCCMRVLVVIAIAACVIAVVAAWVIAIAACVVAVVAACVIAVAACVIAVFAACVIAVAVKLEASLQLNASLHIHPFTIITEEPIYFINKCHTKQWKLKNYFILTDRGMQHLAISLPGLPILSCTNASLPQLGSNILLQPG